MSLEAGMGDLNMTEAEPFKHTLFELQGFGPDLQLGLEMSGQGPENADQDFLDFSQFASTLDQNHHQAMFSSHWQMPVGSGDMPADSGFSGGLDMKEYITNL
jgi:hypothetical protein